jgi:hypothetical protein
MTEYPTQNHKPCSHATTAASAQIAPWICLQEYTFTLTQGDGARVQGFCRRFLPPAPRVGSKLRYPQVLCLVCEASWSTLFFKVGAAVGARLMLYVASCSSRQEAHRSARRMMQHTCCGSATGTMSSFPADDCCRTSSDWQLWHLQRWQRPSRILDDAHSLCSQDSCNGRLVEESTLVLRCRC